FSIASASAEFIVGSVPLRAAIAIWLPIFVNIAPRFASLAPFSRLILDHLLCPAIFASQDELYCYEYTVHLLINPVYCYFTMFESAKLYFVARHRYRQIAII